MHWVIWNRNYSRLRHFWVRAMWAQVTIQTWDPEVLTEGSATELLTGIQSLRFCTTRLVKVCSRRGSLDPPLPLPVLFVELGLID